MSQLDDTFAALSDPTRRAILARLAVGEASVNELMEPFGISQPAISRHLKVLEKAGLVSTRVDGNARPRILHTAPLEEVDRWLKRYRDSWERQFEQLDAVLEALKADPTEKDR